MKTKGMSQQITALELSLGKRNFAYLMEQGTGKTWTALADTERAFVANKIDALLVVAPNGVHSNWIRREIPTHMDIPTVGYIWRGKLVTKKAKAAHAALFKQYPEGEVAPLRVLCMNVEAANTPAGYEAMEEFLASFRVMMIVDESTRIKNPDAKRSQKVVKLGRMAEARRILTGSPLTKAPTDLFMQFHFLRAGLLGTTSYRAFVAEYAVLLQPDDKKYLAIMRKIGGHGSPQVVAEDDCGNKLWKNLDRLSDMILPHSYRVTKKECLDLPPKVYKVRSFQMDTKQQAVYDRLKEDYNYVDMNDEDHSFEAIAARTKLKQVVSGFINIDGEPYLIDPKDNARMGVFKDIIEDVDGSFIVWAMFEEEINQLMAALKEAGISAVSYYGKTSKEAREQAIDDFQAGRVRCFVGHAAAAGIGITLTAANTAIYYSCSYDNELRMQSEDRCHRIGTKGDSVLYYDIVAEDSIDEDTLKSLKVKTQLADYVIDRKRS